MTIRTTTLQGQESSIKPIPPGEGLISFSWQFYDDRKAEFSVAQRARNYFIALLKRLRDYSSLKGGELVTRYSRSTRCHKIVFEDTIMPGFGIPGEENLVEFPFSLSLSSNEHGRIHGFFLGDVYHIVWLDPDHNLYP